MTIHVFVGVGPANLHRALKIQKIDPQAKLVFIDDRINEELREIDREPARANIFRFETDDVTVKLIQDGVRAEELEPLIYKREFSVHQGFQEGDDRVFSSKPFTQIQIRDLQILLMQTIDRKGGANHPLMLKKKLDLENEAAMQAEIAQILQEHQEALEINPHEKADLRIHIATGALRGDSDKNEIIYPDKASHNMQVATSDIQAMTVTPLHGTTTFFIPEPHKEFLDRLRDDQRSLDLTNWQPALEKFGWSLVRPPRIRVFYCNDVLYIGAEIPAQLMNLVDKREFEQSVTDYTRTIATLVFPHLPIKDLPVNPYLRSRFPTSRGERGDVIHTQHEQELAWGEGSLHADVTVLTHGDSRYLPHYQTGSGFVTAFLQNELYAEIYSRNSFEDLVEWAKANHQLYAEINVEKITQQYMKLTNDDEKKALEAFQKELFMAFSRDIIDENKKKVGRYLNATHTQALNALGRNLDMLIKMYNRHHDTQLTEHMVHGFPKEQIILELLKSNSTNFLKEIMPQLLNADFRTVDDKKLLHLRDMHLQDFEHNHNVDASREEKAQIKANQQAIHGIITNNFEEKIDFIISKPEKLVENITNIAERLKNNPVLHQRAAISIFTGAHSAKINKFAQKIDELTKNYSDNPEQLEQEAKKALIDFHTTLKKGSSRRTMSALQELVQEAVESTQELAGAARNV